MSYSNISNNNNQHDHAGTVHRNYKHQPSTFSIVPSSTNQYNAYYYKNNSNINYTIHVIHDDADSPTSSNNGGGANPLQPLEARLESLHLVMSTTPAIATTEITPASPSSPSTSDPFNANNPLAPPIGPATTKKATTTTTTTTTPKSQFSNHLYFDFNSNNNNDKTLQHADNTAAAEIIGEEGEADDEDDIMYDASEYDDELGFLVQRFDLQEESAKRSAFMPYIC